MKAYNVTLNFLAKDREEAKRIAEQLAVKANEDFASLCTVILVVEALSPI